MLFEVADGPLRKFSRATAASLSGPWRIETVDYAAGSQLRYSPGAERWTDEVSHGELLRTGNDERLEVPARPVQFLIQGMPAGLHQGDYPTLPWRLGLITR
jgi:endo-1,4-beta-xylanase